MGVTDGLMHDKGADKGAAELDRMDEPLPPPTGDNDPALFSPLAPWGGAAPPAPAWFEEAISAPHSRNRVTVNGAAIEWLSWGDPGRPGLMLFHGNGANADWWRFTAPLLARTHHVVAPSWSGMGNSDHRPAYSISTFVAEAMAVADAAGFTAPFTVAGHSFGGFPALGLGARHADRIAQVIVIDSPLVALDGPPRTERKPHRIYPTLAAALARFRWSPVQPSPNPWATDFIARSALKQVDGGWTWKFDPFIWAHFDHSEHADHEGLIRQVRPPIAYMWGERSALVQSGDLERIRRILPGGTRLVGIAEAHHHVMADQPLALVAAIRGLLA